MEATNSPIAVIRAIRARLASAFLSASSDYLDLGGRRRPRLGGVKGKGTKQLTVVGQNRLGPPRTYSVPNGELSKFVGPEGIGCNVGDNDPFFPIRGGAAAPMARTDRPAHRGGVPRSRYARAGRGPKPLAFRLHDHNR